MIAICNVAFNLFGIFDIISDIAETLAEYAIIILFVFISLGIVLPIVLNKKAANEGRKSTGCAYLLFLFWGIIAAHRFYANKAGSAILWIFTGGFFGFGFIIDIFLIPSMINTYNINAKNQRIVKQNNQMMQQNLISQNAMMQQIQSNQNNFNNPQPQYQQQYTPNGVPVQNTPQNALPYSTTIPKLIGVSGEYVGVSLDIDASGIILGRDPAYSHLVFKNTEFSRKHCVISYSASQLMLTDYSSNGTYLMSGERLINGVPKQLLPGDVFYLVDQSEMFKVDY